jgi:origin recognition complex subunit 2
MDLKRKEPSADDPGQDMTIAPPSKRARSDLLNGANETDPQIPDLLSPETPKWKRGQPPGSKSKTGSTGVGFVTSSSPATNGTHLTESYGLDHPSIEAPKRKRGRPSGSKTKTDRIANGFVSSSSPPPTKGGNARVSQLLDHPSIDTIKRKRGRPPGSKTKTIHHINGFVTSSSPPTTNGLGGYTLPTRNAHNHSDPTVPNGDYAEPEEENDELQLDVLEISNAASRELAELDFKRTLAGDNSEGEELEEEHHRITQQLLDGMRDAQSDGIRNDGEDASLIPATPAPPKKRGRPKGSTRKRSPTPPLPDLPPHERYFYQNRLGAVRTSTNTLSSLNLLDHDEYFGIMNKCKDPHLPERQYLEELHSRSFSQWQFELHESFNICLYGWGSKRGLVNRYASWLHSTLTSHGHDPTRRIIIINGYVSTLTTRDILNTINTTIHPQIASDTPTDLQTTLSQLPQSYPPLTLLINSIDSPSLRRPATQTLLATLSSHRGINLIATADVPNFPLLWDSTLREMYNFLFHDCTTFSPFGAEMDVIESVHELLGRSGRRSGGREGVAFVLRSLPENARNLYRVLVSEQLAMLDEALENAPADAEAGEEDTQGAVEYRVLYQKAVEEFICSSEMAFRTLLKEFHDHQMLKSRKDGLGAEMLWVPFRREELEAVLEDLVL